MEAKTSKRYLLPIMLQGKKQASTVQTTLGKFLTKN